MQVINEMLLSKINSLISEGKAQRVFAWKKGEFGYDESPWLFTDSIKGLVYDGFSAPNLCKYMIEESAKEGKVLLPLKPCDSRGLKLLENEYRINRDNIYALGIPCGGKADINKIKALGITGIIDIEETDNEYSVKTLSGDVPVNKKAVLSDKCLACQSKEHIGCDELFMPELSEDTAEGDKFSEVEKLEKMTAEERFTFWRSQLSKCIRCNACRNVCPACSCVKCVFDNDASGVASKANADDFEEDLYHIIRSFHVCGRCIDCGECSRVCPENIPLHLLNRKYIKDINELYGEEDGAALLTFSKDDPEPGIIYERGGGNV